MVEIELKGLWNMRKLIQTAKNQEDFSIVLRGWKKDYLLPVLLKHMPQAEKTNLEYMTPNRNPNWLPKQIFVWRWVGLLISIYEIAVESGTRVSVVGGEPTVIFFKSQLKAGEMTSQA